MAIVVVKNESGSVEQVKISKKIFTIGKKKKGNDLVIDQGSVSRQHCRIIFRDGAYTIQDAGSMNGTFLNGRRIMQETPLMHGSQIRVGDVEVTFIDEEYAARAKADLAPVPAQAPSAQPVAQSAAPAPVATTNGMKPAIDAIEVMRIGRKRSCAASTAASRMLAPCSRCALANSTMRIAFLLASPMSRTMPI